MWKARLANSWCNVPHTLFRSYQNGENSILLETSRLLYAIWAQWQTASHYVRIPIIDTSILEIMPFFLLIFTKSLSQALAPRLPAFSEKLHSTEIRCDAVLHNKSSITQKIVKHLGVPNSKGIKPLCSCLSAFARDLGQEVYPSFQTEMLPALLKLLDTKDAEQLEDVFSVLNPLSLSMDLYWWCQHEKFKSRTYACTYPKTGTISSVHKNEKGLLHARQQHLWEHIQMFLSCP